MGTVGYARNANSIVLSHQGKCCPDEEGHLMNMLGIRLHLYALLWYFLHSIVCYLEKQFTANKGSEPICDGHV